MARDRSLDSLQPEFRSKVVEMLDNLKSTSEIDWQVFETWRPVSTKCGIVNPATSKTDPCENPTKHGYGAAVDIVPNGTWGPKGTPWRKASWPQWDELRAAAHSVGLDNDISWDRPHVEVSRKQIVIWLQEDLGVKADGIWGPNTDKAAKEMAAQLDIEWKEPVPSKGAKINPVTYRELRARIGRNVTGKAIAGGAFFLVVAIAFYLVKKG